MHPLWSEIKLCIIEFIFLNQKEYSNTTTTGSRICLCGQMILSIRSPFSYQYKANKARQKIKKARGKASTAILTTFNVRIAKKSLGGEAPYVFRDNTTKCVPLLLRAQKRAEYSSSVSIGTCRSRTTTHRHFMGIMHLSILPTHIYPTLRVRNMRYATRGYTLQWNIFVGTAHYIHADWATT